MTFKDYFWVKMWSRKSAKMGVFPRVEADFEVKILVSIHFSYDLRRLVFYDSTSK